MVYARINLKGGGSYVVPVAEIGLTMDAEVNGDGAPQLDAEYTITFVEMTPEQYAALPEFAGH